MDPTAADEEEAVFEPREFPIGGDAFSYIAALARRAPGAIIFRTGSGRVLRDLLLHWPALEDWEDEALDLCQRIADAVYPLTSALYAQGIEIAAMISPAPIEAPERIDALSTYVLFDMERRTERHCFLSPHHPLPRKELLRAAKGIAVLCRPLNYRYHTIKDDRQRIGHPHAGIFELGERLRNEILYEQPDFVPREKRIFATVKAEVKALPQAVERAEASRNANLSLETRHLAPPASVIASTTSLSALPPPVRALERRLMAYVADKSLSADLRLQLRQTAQALRAHYPQAVIEEAARRETAPPAARASSAQRPSPQAAPHTTLRPVYEPQTGDVAYARFASIPLSVRPSVLLPAAAMPPAGSVSAPRVSVRQPQARPAVTERRMGEPAPQRERPRAEPRQAAQQPETRPASQPTVERRAEAAPQRERARTEQQREQPRAEPRQTAQQPEARPSAQPATERRAEIAPQREQARAEPTRPQPRQQAAQPAVQPAAPAERRVSEPAPQREQARMEPRRQTAQQPETRPAAQPFSPRQSEARALPHSFADMETRPPRFYESLKKPGPSFPKAVPVSGAGKLDKIARPPTLDKAIAPSHSVSPLARLWMFPTPSPTPAPHSPVLRSKK